MVNKAQWHKDVNGGSVPLLETPKGDIIRESGVIAILADELGGNNGINLFPKDPIQAAKLRLELENFMKFVQPFGALQMSLGKDEALIDKFGVETLNLYEKMCSGDGWLYGTP